MSKENLKIVPISSKLEDSKAISVVQLLEEVLREFNEGEIEATDCYLCFVDRSVPGDYQTRWRMAGLSSSEAIALLEIMKIRMVGTMNFVTSPDNS